MPDPARVPSSTVYASPAHAATVTASTGPANEAAMRSGPSTRRLRPSIGIGGTTDIHSVRCSGLGAAASRVARLPKAHPRPPSTTSRNGHGGAPSAREAPTTIRPPTATVTPTSARRPTRSRSSSAPSSTVNGAEDCSTSDARPAGNPAAMPR